MKSLQSKNITSSNSINSPFFQKESSNNFFGKSKKPFFNSTSIQAKLTVNQPNDTYEKEADAMADNVVQRLSTNAADGNSSNNTNNLSIQRKCATCEHEEEKIQKKEPNDSTDAGIALPQPATAAPPINAARFIIDDNVVPGTGQMKKTDFLNRLKEEVCLTVNEALAGTPFSSDNCPYIRAAFTKHQGSTPLQLEQLIARYEPSTAQAQSADDLIQRMKIKVFAAAKQWVKNGGKLSETVDILRGMAGNIGSAVADVAGGIGSAVADVVGGVSSVVSDVASGVGSAIKGGVPSIGGLFFKANEGGASATQSSQGVMQSLGKGNSIDSSSRSKMESAFGTNFSNVEVHTDNNAAKLSKDMNARAFAVGNHIAFASGEHKPGTLIGDTLMAHELVHVVQQKDAIAQTKSETNNQMLEEDADQKAATVMAKTLTGKDIDLKKKGNKGLKTGLSIQRCNSCGNSSPGPSPIPTEMTFTEIKAAFLTPVVSGDPAKKSQVLQLGINRARRVAHELFQHPEDSLIKNLRSRIISETKIPSLEPNPMIGVSQDNVEQAYRAWAESLQTKPWILLALWKKEGLGNEDSQRQINSAIVATSVNNVKAIYRSRYFYLSTGTDHFGYYQPTTGDNQMHFDDAHASQHETTFQTKVQEMVSLGFLARNISSEINSELTVTELSPGTFTVTPTSNFHTLSLLLADAYFRYNDQQASTNPAVGANHDIGLTYNRWNMGGTRFNQYITSADAHRKEPAFARPDGSSPSIADWAFHTTIKRDEFPDPRRNAVRFKYFSEVFMHIYDV